MEICISLFPGVIEYTPTACESFLGESFCLPSRRARRTRLRLYRAGNQRANRLGSARARVTRVTRHAENATMKARMVNQPCNWTFPPTLRR